MKKLKWKESFRFQELWFKGLVNDYPWESYPVLNYYSFEWALKFKRFEELYKANEDVWKDDDAISQLRKEIKKMVDLGYANLPNNVNKITRFGREINDSMMIEVWRKREELDNKEASEMMPLFEKFYFKYVEFDNDGIYAPLDDLTGTVGPCVIHFTAIGTLEYVNDQKTIATITELGVYIRDNFDFVGKGRLGFWSKEDSDVTKFGGKSYKYIENEDYRNYSKATGFGMNFYTYSTMKVFKPNYKFDL
jgi:hypothetical protein